MRQLFQAMLALTAVACAMSGPSPAAADTEVQPRLEHIAIWAADIDKTAAFLADALGWRRHPLEFGVRDDSTVFGGMKLAFVDANGFWLELVEPTTEGPGMEFLRQKGNGSIVELDFFVDDFDTAVAWLKSKGIEPMGMDGKPMQNGGLLQEWASIDGKIRNADERLAYLPIDVARGTSIELGWEYPSGVVYYRDDTWGPKERTPCTTPRMDHVSVAAADLEDTTKVYTRVLELKRVPDVPGLRRDWMGVTESGQTWIHGNAGVWVNVVAPAGAAGGKILQDPRFGDGNIMEMAAEVADIDAFYDDMKAKGIVMTAGDGTPLPAGQKSVLVEPTGDRYSYFPLDKSEGMRILVFQRGPRKTSAFQRRDSVQKEGRP
jgi:catechol 2,3-dioxygenase-like lactoylglutathione lyase family enzyme